MGKSKSLNVSELINDYDNNEFIASISLKNITTNKELKELLSKLEKAKVMFGISNPEEHEATPKDIKQTLAIKEKLRKFFFIKAPT